jgi:hypothetical protein
MVCRIRRFQATQGKPKRKSYAPLPSPHSRTHPRQRGVGPTLPRYISRTVLANIPEMINTAGYPVLELWWRPPVVETAAQRVGTGLL